MLSGEIALKNNHYYYNIRLVSFCGGCVIVKLPQTPEDDSEKLEMHKESGRVSHSWCMGVVSHGYRGSGLGWKWWLVSM